MHAFLIAFDYLHSARRMPNVVICVYVCMYSFAHYFFFLHFISLAVYHVINLAMEYEWLSQ